MRLAPSRFRRDGGGVAFAATVGSVCGRGLAVRLDGGNQTVAITAADRNRRLSQHKTRYHLKRKRSYQQTLYSVPKLVCVPPAREGSVFALASWRL